MGEVFVNGCDQLGHAGEGATAQPIDREVAKEALDHVQPRGRSRREVHVKARALGQPALHGQMFVRGVVVRDTAQQ